MCRDDLRLNAGGVLASDDPLERRGDEDVHRELQDLFVRDFLAAPGGHRPLLVLRGEDAVESEAPLVVEAALRVGDGDDPRARLVEELRDGGAGVAEPLDRGGGAVQREPEALRGLLDRDEATLRRCLAAAGRASDRVGVSLSPASRWTRECAAPAS